MTIERDAAFLAGFIVGTYDLRGDAAPPTFIQPFLDRVLNTVSIPKMEEIVQGLTPPKSDFHKEAKAATANNLGIVDAMPADETETVLPELTRRMLEKAKERKDEPTVIMVQPERNTSLDDDGENRVELVRRLAGMGWTDAGIAKKLGLSLQGVFAIRKRHGILPGRKQKANGHVQTQTQEAAAEQH